MSFQDLEAGRGIGSRRGCPPHAKRDPAQAVASGIFQINTAVSTFQRLVSSLGTHKDAPELRNKLHKTRLHIEQLVKDTSVKLKQASETDRPAQVSADKKIMDAKFARDFETVVKEFQKFQQLAAQKERTDNPFIPQSVPPSSMDRDANTRVYKNPEQQSLVVETKRQEVVLLENEIAYNEAIVDEREQAIQEIQQQVGEVNEIFTDLAILVREQGPMIGDIESNIKGAQTATAQGKSHLAEASKTQKSSSSLICFLLVMVVIVLLIVTILFVA